MYITVIMNQINVALRLLIVSSKRGDETTLRIHISFN